MNYLAAWFAIERNRAYVYRVVTAIGGVLAAYGFLTADQLAQAVGLTAVLLNILPVANTTTKDGLS